MNIEYIYKFKPPKANKSMFAYICLLVERYHDILRKHDIPVWVLYEKDLDIIIRGFEYSEFLQNPRRDNLKYFMIYGDKRWNKVTIKTTLDITTLLPKDIKMEYYGLFIPTKEAKSWHEKFVEHFVDNLNYYYRYPFFQNVHCSYYNPEDTVRIVYDENGMAIYCSKPAIDVFTDLYKKCIDENGLPENQKALT